MRTVWLVAYDVSDPKRLRRVHKTVDGYGDRIQYSVYRCLLTEKERVLLRNRLQQRINAEQDRVLFVALGPAGGTRARVDTLGPPLPPERQSQVVL